MKRILMIIDPQVDFIAGSLPVPGAEQPMNALAEYVRAEAGRYDLIIVTADRHPADHCSFAENGGPWPRHCVEGSGGATVWPPLNDALTALGDKVLYLYKGIDPGHEEYSIFKNHNSAAEIDRIIKDGEVTGVDVCGLAGDVCVAGTLRDGVGLYGRGLFHVLPEFTPSLDGGKTLKEVEKTL